MVTIRRKHNSFTVISGKERYTGKRREDGYHIHSEGNVIVLEYDMTHTLKASGMEEFTIQRLAPKALPHLHFEMKLNDRYYTLSLPEEGQASFRNPLGMEFILDKEARHQEILQKVWPQGIAILYAIYLLLDELRIEGFFL